MNLASRLLAGSMASLAVLAPWPTVTAASSEARVTQIIRDVKLLPSEADARPAAVDDKVSEDTAVRTGGESRSELTFSDLTITRLGADTIFSFSKAGRTAKLDSGSILLRVPKDSRGGAINTNSVTVAITGTTVIFESDAAGNSKLITLEGRARLSLVKDPRRVRNVRAGQMLDVPPDATMLPVPVEVDLDELMRTHPLITDFAPLPSQDLIAAVALQQRNSSPGGRPGIRPRPSPSPSATRPQRSPSPTPRIVTPTPSPKPSVTPTPTPTSTPKLTPTPSPSPSETPTPKPSPTASSTPAPSPTRGPYDYWTPTPPPRPSPTPSPTPAPSPSRSPNFRDRTPPPSPSATRHRPDPTPQIATPTPKPIVTPTPRPILTSTPKPTPSPFAPIGPRVTATPFKPTPSLFPIRRATPTPTPAQIRKLVLPTPKPRASPTPIKRPPASPIPKRPKPTPTPVIR